MACQRGPGKGFHASRALALAIDDKLKCRAIQRNQRLVGYVVEDAIGKTIGMSATQARDAWADAYCKLRTGDPEWD